MKRTKRLLVAAAWAILLSFVALTAATYAWMSITSSYRVSDLDVFVITENALEIAADNNGAPGEWKKALVADEIMPTDPVLRPVTWSDTERVFYSPGYGIDGRTNFDVKSIVATTEQSLTPSADKAENADGVGYLVAADFWVRTGSSRATVYLSGPISDDGVEISKGTYVVGAPQWDGEKHSSSGNGAERVVRFGFMTYDYYDNSGNLIDEGGFCIYEPNTVASEQTKDAAGNSLEGGSKLIKQTSSTFTDLNPPLENEVEYQTGDFLTDDTKMFTIKGNIPRRVTLFIWLEGYDESCDNTISAGKLLANIQISGDTQSNQQGIGRPKGGGGE